MNVRRLIVTPGIVAVAAVLLAVSAIMDAAGGQNGQSVAPAPQIVGFDIPAPPQPYVSTAQSAASPVALSSTLSYYFISGNTFTPGGPVSYSRQVTGCVNQMPQGVPFSAPVHLPQGSQVGRSHSIRLMQ